MHSIVESSFSAGFQITSSPDGATISFNADSAPIAVACPLINHDFIGISQVTKQGIENPDGTPVVIDKDLFGKSRNVTHPCAGPFEDLRRGLNTYQLDVGAEAHSTNSTNPSPTITRIHNSASQLLANNGSVIMHGVAGSLLRIIDTKGRVAASGILGPTGSGSFALAQGFYYVTASPGSKARNLTVR